MQSRAELYYQRRAFYYASKVWSEGEADAKLRVLQSMLLSSQTSSLPDQDIARIVDLAVEEVANMRARLSKMPRE